MNFNFNFTALDKVESIVYQIVWAELRTADKVVRDGRGEPVGPPRTIVALVEDPLYWSDWDDYSQLLKKKLGYIPTIPEQRNSGWSQFRNQRRRAREERLWTSLGLQATGESRRLDNQVIDQYSWSPFTRDEVPPSFLEKWGI